MNIHKIKIDSNKAILPNAKTIVTPYRIKKAWHESDKNITIVLMDYAENRNDQLFHNIECYSYDNKKLWEADLPSKLGPEAYTDAEFEGESFIAFSFSCFSCSIDIDNGKIIKKIFTK